MRIRKDFTVVRKLVATFGRLIEEVATDVVPVPKVCYVPLDIGHRPCAVIGVNVPNDSDSLVAGRIDGGGKR